MWPSSWATWNMYWASKPDSRATKMACRPPSFTAMAVTPLVWAGNTRKCRTGTPSDQHAVITSPKETKGRPFISALRNFRGSAGTTWLGASSAIDNRMRPTPVANPTSASRRAPSASRMCLNLLTPVCRNPTGTSSSRRVVGSRFNRRARSIEAMARAEGDS